MTETANERTWELAEALRTALSALAGQSVDFCVLRNYEELPEYTTHDVDVLVDDSQLSQAAETIKRACGRCNWRLAAEVRTASSHSLYMYYDSSENVQYLSFDLVTDLQWGWASTIDVQYVLATKGAFRGIPVASKGCDAAMRLTKALLRGLDIKDSAREVITQGALADGNAFMKAIRGFLNHKLTDTLLGYAQAGDFRELRNLRKRTCMSVLWRFHARRPITSFHAMLKYLIHRIRMFSRGPLGVCAVLLGPDGAGKTTLTDRLVRRAGTLFFRGFRIYHHEFHVLPRLKDLIRPWTLFLPKRKRNANEHSNQATRPCGFMRSLLHLGYYAIDYSIGRLILRHLQGHSKLVLFDRYYYDYYFQPGHKNTPHWLVDIFRIFAPKPDVVLLLQADPEKIHARKPELTIEEIARQLKVAQAISDKLGANIPMITIKTDLSTVASERQASVAILHVLSRKNYRRDMKVAPMNCIQTAGEFER